jgi:hypothetical protein
VAPGRRSPNRHLSYRDYLRLEGLCSLALGLELAVVAFPGLILSYPAAWAGVLFVPAILLGLGLWGWLRHGASLDRPGEWLTTRPLRSARRGGPILRRRRVRRRVLAETAAWIAGVTLWVVAARSLGLLVFGTGLAAAAFGAIQLFLAREHVRREERRRGVTYYLSRRPGLGTPDLTRVRTRAVLTSWPNGRDDAASARLSAGAARAGGR